MICYYAHSLLTYGTVKEYHERTFLETKFQKVICPNRDLGGNSPSVSMEPFLNMVSVCNVLVVSEFRGFIGKEVFTEVCRAAGENKQILVLRKVNSSLKLLEFKKVVLNDESDWKLNYGIVYVKSEKKTNINKNYENKIS